MELYAVLLVTRNNIYSEKAIDCLFKEQNQKRHNKIYIYSQKII